MDVVVHPAEHPAPTLIGGAGRTPRPVPVATRRLRIALLDEQEGALERTAGWLAVHAPDLEVVLTATTWAGLVQSPAFPTDVVVLDVQLAGAVSIEARVRTCRAAGATVVVLTASADEALHGRAIAAGAARVVGPGRPLADLAEAARDGADGEPHAWRPLPAAAEAAIRPRLSLGEEEALRLYVSGHSTNEVAAAMNVRYETAKTYLRRVRNKYARVNRPASKKAELTRRAVEDGYLR